MSHESLDESLLSAYLDGELSASERELVEQALESSASLRQLLEELRLVRRLVVDAVLHGSSADADGAAPMDLYEPSFTDRLGSRPDRNALRSDPKGVGSTAPWLVDRRHPASLAPSAADEETSSNPIGPIAASQVELPSSSWWTVRNVAMAVSALAASWLLGLLVFSGREPAGSPIASQSDSPESVRLEPVPSDSVPSESVPSETESSESGTDPSMSELGIREESGLAQSSRAGVSRAQNHFEAEHRGLQEDRKGVGEKWDSVKPLPDPQDLRFTRPASPSRSDPAAKGAVATDASSAAAIPSPSGGGLPGAGRPSMPPSPKLSAKQEDQTTQDNARWLRRDDFGVAQPGENGDQAAGNSGDLRTFSKVPDTFWYDTFGRVEEFKLQEYDLHDYKISNEDSALSEFSQVTTREYTEERFFEDVQERLTRVEAWLALSLAQTTDKLAERDVAAKPLSVAEGTSNATPPSGVVPRTLFFAFLPEGNSQATQGTWVESQPVPSPNSATNFFSDTSSRNRLAIPDNGAPQSAGDASTGTGAPENVSEFSFGIGLSKSMPAKEGGIWLLFSFRDADSESALQALRQLGVQWDGMETNRNPLVLLHAERTAPTRTPVQLGLESLPGSTDLLARDSVDASNLPGLDSVARYGAAGFGSQVPIDQSAKETEPAAGAVEPSAPARMRGVAIYLSPSSKPASKPE
ncbi:MAG: zf-HC2 domain-containing protein [Pirellula sp.]